MTGNKRYVVETGEISLKDNLTKKYPFSINCEKDYYNELVLQEYYHKLFNEEIESKVLKPLKKSIINTFTGFERSSFGGHEFVDDNGKKVRVIVEVTTDESYSLIEENRQLKSENKILKNNIDELMEVNAKFEGKILDDNGQLKQDKIRLIGYLHRYGFVSVDEVDELVLNEKRYDEWGELYYDR